MTKRFSIEIVEPEAHKAMMALSKYSKTFELNPNLIELIKIRASQLNGCAYCIDMHTEYAVILGESTRRIFLLSAWQESNLFSAQEKAVLQLTEEITNISANGVTDETYNNLLNHFTEKLIAQLIMVIVLINSWNRITVATKLVYK